MRSLKCRLVAKYISQEWAHKSTAVDELVRRIGAGVEYVTPSGQTQTLRPNVLRLGNPKKVQWSHTSSGFITIPVGPS